MLVLYFSHKHLGKILHYPKGTLPNIFADYNAILLNMKTWQKLTVVLQNNFQPFVAFLTADGIPQKSVNSSWLCSAYRNGKSYHQKKSSNIASKIVSAMQWSMWLWVLHSHVTWAEKISPLSLLVQLSFLPLCCLVQKLYVRWMYQQRQGLANKSKMFSVKHQSRACVKSPQARREWVKGGIWIGK